MRASSAGKDPGATSVEYALMVSFIATVIVGGVTALGLGVLGLFNSIFPTL